METATASDWGRALVLLVTVSALFLALRISGRAFVGSDFEILVIHVPTIVCLLMYMAERRFRFLSKPATALSKS
jgi:hypothetical protein